MKQVFSRAWESKSDKLVGRFSPLEVRQRWLVQGSRRLTTKVSRTLRGEGEGSLVIRGTFDSWLRRFLSSAVTLQVSGVVSEVMKAVDEDNERGALHIVHRFVLDNMRRGQLTPIARLMRSLDVTRLPDSVMLAPLVVTSSLRVEVPGRSEYLGRVAKQLSRLKRQDISALLSGL